MQRDAWVLRDLPHGWASDVEVLALTGSSLRDHGDHLVISTPANPDYYWGNLVVVRDPDRCDDAAAWLQRFVEAFPAATHRSIGLPTRPDPAAWQAVGLRVESDEVLVAGRPPRARPLAQGYADRRLVSAGDWADAAGLELDEELSQAGASGWDAATVAAHDVFVRRRWQARAAASAGGAAAFFAVYQDELPVAQLGIVLCSDHARYQSVLTHREHRGRGLAGHLLAVAGSWAADQGARRWRILVEPGSAAARLYRDVGFGLDSASWQASSS